MVPLISRLSLFSQLLHFSKSVTLIKHNSIHTWPCLNSKIKESERIQSLIKLKVPEISNSKTFQDKIFKYLCSNYYSENIIQKHILVQDIVSLDEFFSKSEKASPDSLTKLILNKHLTLVLPTYIITLKQRRISKKYVTLCDWYCAQNLNFNLDESKSLSSLDFLHAWLMYLYPSFHRITQMQCYGKLIQNFGREVFNASNANSSKHSVHLAFLAGIGKKNMFESHELLNQLANMCDSSPEITYKLWDPFELSIVCESFYKGGIKIISEDFLSYISKTICQLLSESLKTRRFDGFEPFIVISSLKILRQVNYVEDKLLNLLSEMILQPQNEKVFNIRFLTNIVAAFVGPGRRNLSQDSESDVSVIKVLNRIEHLVLDIIRDEEDARSGIKKEILRTTDIKNSWNGTSTTTKEVDSSMKSRLKDISRWLWASASLGYPISPEAYHKDLSWRYSSGDFFRRPVDAVDALVALSIMNHYLDVIVMKVLHSPDFRSALRVKCSKRYKGRFGLFLTSLKIERNDLWRQLSPQDVMQLMDIVGPSRSETEGWSSEHLRVKARHDKMTSVSSIRDYIPHSKLLNQCMDALNVIFNSAREDNNDLENENCSYKNTIDASSSKVVDYRWNKDCDAAAQNFRSQNSAVNTSSIHNAQYSQHKVLHGYAVPYLHIPGIKVILPNTGRELYLEVLDDEAISPGLHQFKLRLLAKMGCTVLSITREEVIQCPNLAAYLEVNIRRKLGF